MFFFFVLLIIIVLNNILERFRMGTDMLSADRLRRAPASNDGKIITFLPSMCEWSRYGRLHVVGCLLVVITIFCPSCEAALRQPAAVPLY